MTKKLIKLPQPRYDDVFFEGVRWLDWIAINEGIPICAYFQNIDHGIECTTKNCPCDIYEKER